MTSMDYTVLLENESVPISVAELGDGRIRIDGELVDACISISEISGSDVARVSLVADGRSYTFLAVRTVRGRWKLQTGGVTTTVDVLDKGAVAVREMALIHGEGHVDTTLRAPMPGLVIAVRVSVGDSVEAGDGVVVVSAMKMENELKSPVSGTVRLIHVASGDAVRKDQILVEFEV